MHSEDIEELESPTEGERKVFRFLREVARPDYDFIGWEHLSSVLRVTKPPSPGSFHIQNSLVWPFLAILWYTRGHQGRHLLPENSPRSFAWSEHRERQQVVLPDRSLSDQQPSYGTCQNLWPVSLHFDLGGGRRTSGHPTLGLPTVAPDFLRLEVDNNNLAEVDNNIPEGNSNLATSPSLRHRR